MGFEAMYEWSKGLTDGQVDEGEHTVTIRVGNKIRDVDNATCTARGRHGDKAVVVTWSAYQVEGFSATSSSYVRDVLDVFIADKSVVLEGIVRQRGLLGALLAGIGIGGGWKPHNHSLFKTCKVHRDDETAGTTRLEDPAHCDRVLRLIEAGCYKIEYQAKTGISAFFRAPTGPDAALLGPAFEGTLALLEQGP